MPVSYVTDLPRTADLVVIGGGIVGAATAFHAARQGLRPLLIERRPRLCTLTTPASAGAFRLQFDNREEYEVVCRSVELFLSFEEVTGQREYELGVRRQGYLWVTTDERRAEQQRELIRAQRGWGLDDVELLSGDEVRRRFPWISGDVVQARFRQGDGFLDPKALTLGLALGSRAPVLTSCGVMGFELRSGKVSAVVTQWGTVSTETVVIAAGPFSAELARLAGVDLPITTVARQKLVMPSVPEVPPDAPFVIDDDNGVHWRPALQGAYVLYSDPATPPSPPTEDVPPDHAAAFRLLDPASPLSVARTAPFWRRVWDRASALWMLQCGQYALTPDHHPLIGLTPVEGLYVNTGYSGHGIMAGPAGSALLAEVLIGRVSPDQNPFRLDRTFEARRHDLL